MAAFIHSMDTDTAAIADPAMVTNSTTTKYMRLRKLR